MSFSESGGIITQTGTDTDLSGLTGISGVTTNVFNFTTEYILYDRTLKIDGTCTQARTDHLVISGPNPGGTDKLSLLITNGGTFIFGEPLVFDDLETTERTVYSGGQFLYLAKPTGPSSWKREQAGITVESGGAMEIYGGYIRQNQAINFEAGSSLIMRKGRVGASSDVGFMNFYLRDATVDIIGFEYFCVEEVPNAALGVLAAYDTFEGYDPTGIDIPIGPIDVLPFGNITIEKYAGGGKNPIDVNFRNPTNDLDHYKMMEATIGNDLIVRGRAVNNESRGWADHYIRWEPTFIDSISKAALVDIQVYMIDTDSTNRNSPYSPGDQIIDLLTLADGQFSATTLDVLTAVWHNDDNVMIAQYILDDRLPVAGAAIGYLYEISGLALLDSKVGKDSANVQMVLDANITEQTIATTAAYTTLDDNAQFYDRSKEELFSDYTGELVKNIAVAGAYLVPIGDLIIDPAASVAYEIAAGVITIKSSGFTGKLDMGWFYYFHDEFTTPDAAPITDPRTCEPGPGTLGFYEEDGTLSIVDGKFTFTPQSTPDWEDQLGFWSNEAPPMGALRAGTTLSVEMNISTWGECAFAWYRYKEYVWQPDDDHDHGIYVLPTEGELALIVEANSIPVMDDFAADTPHSIALVMRSQGCHYIVDGKLRFVGDFIPYGGSSTTDFWAQFSNYDAGGTLENLSISQLVDNGYPIWGDDVSLKTQEELSNPPAQAFDCDADCHITCRLKVEDGKFVHTKFRYTDSSNHVALEINSNIPTLKKYVTGTPTTLWTGDALIQNDTHTWGILAEGTSIKVHKDNILVTSQTVTEHETVAGGYIDDDLGVGFLQLSSWPWPPILGLATDHALYPEGASGTMDADSVVCLRNHLDVDAGLFAIDLRIDGGDELTLQVDNGTITLKENGVTRIESAPSAMNELDDITIILDGAFVEVFSRYQSHGSYDSLTVLNGTGWEVTSYVAACPTQVEFYPRDVSSKLPPAPGPDEPGRKVTQMGTGGNIDYEVAGELHIDDASVSWSVTEDVSNLLNDDSGNNLVALVSNGATVHTGTPGTGNGEVQIINAVDITVTALDQTGTAIVGARVAVYQTSDDAELMNELTISGGIATEVFDFVSDTDIYWAVRKSSSGTRYFPAKGTGTITSAGLTFTVTMIEDPIAI